MNLQLTFRGVATWLLIGWHDHDHGDIGWNNASDSRAFHYRMKPITGLLPPMNDIAWQAEFDKYKVTDRSICATHFSLSEFKPFFLGVVHRVWGRLMGIV
jgi:hypothetical protein